MATLKKDKTRVPPSGSAHLQGVVISNVPAAPSAKPSAADANSGALQLLDVEAQAREAATLQDLALVISNATRKLTRARQIFVFSGSARGELKVIAATGIPAVDRNVPLVQWIEQTVARAAAEADLGDLCEFVLHAYSDPGSDSAKTYPFREALWMPLRHRNGLAIGGAMMVRETPWLEQDTVLARRLAMTFSHAWSALTGGASAQPLLRINRRRSAIAAIAVAAVGVFPVPMTSLAPFEVTPRDAYLVTAPIEGVIDDILVQPNTRVAAGQPLVRFVDTVLRNRVELAKRESDVAKARVKQATIGAFSDVRGRHEASILQAEQGVKDTELEQARALLDLSAIAAARDGVAVFGDKRDLIGRPVSVGEKLMDVADPRKVELKISVPVGDSLLLTAGARVKAFLESDPLRPIEGKVVRSDYHARPSDGGVLAFRVIADLEGGDADVPRFGVRGTAQLYGGRVPLAYYLFRRPIAKLRQWMGM
jgi:HlyD family secretion protein